MKKNIFFVERLDETTGWGTLSLNYIKKLNPENVLIFCNKKNLSLSYDQFDVLPDVNSLIRNPLKIFYKITRIRNIIKKLGEDYDLFSHFTVEPYVIYLPLINFFKKNFYYAIGTYSSELYLTKKTKFLFWLSIKLIDKVIYFSSYTKKKVLNIPFFTKKEGLIINPVIYPLKYENYDFKKYDDITMLSVGMLKARKGYLNLIEVMNILVNKENKKFKLNIVGKSNDKNYDDLLFLKIKEYKLEKFVKILTEINDHQLNEMYKKSHLFILLSEDQKNHFEGFGIVYLEALSFNLPIIVSNQTGAKDLKSVSNKIYFVDPKDYYTVSNLICDHFLDYFSKELKNEYVGILDIYNHINDKKISEFYKKELV